MAQVSTTSSVVGAGPMWNSATLASGEVTSAGREACRGPQRDRAHGVEVDVAADLQHQRVRAVPVDQQAGVDRRQRRRCEPDVHDGAAHR